MRYTRAHSRVVEVVSVPARNRSREHRVRLVSLKPRLVSLFCSERQELVQKVNFTVHRCDSVTSIVAHTLCPSQR